MSKAAGFELPAGFSVMVEVVPLVVVGMTSVVPFARRTEVPAGITDEAAI